MTVYGTAGNNSINVASNGASVVVTGLSAQGMVNGAEAANDMLVVNRFDGNDTLIGSGDDIFGFVLGESGQDMVLGFQAHGAGP